MKHSEFNMKSVGQNLFLLIIASLISLCSLTAHALDWQQPTTGVSYTKLRVEQPEQDVYLDVFRIDPRKTVIRPIVSATRKTAQQFANESNALVVLNANFFDEKFQPLGLVQDEGRTINPFKNISWWSVFCLKDQKPLIVHSSQAKGIVCDAAVQAGPRLVVDGSIPKLKDDLSYRTVLGINRQQDVLFVVARDLISTQDLAQVLAKPESEGGLDCFSALNLDGGSSTQIYASVGGLRVSFGGLVAVPVGLGAFAK